MNNVWLFLLVFSFLLLAGCPGKDAVIPSKEEASITVDSWSAEVEEDETPAPEDWVEQALDEEDPAYCLKLPANERDDCILPLSNDSLPNCLQLVEYEKKRQCLFHHAYAGDDISICDLMNDVDREECVEYLAPPCTFVLEANQKARCLAFEYQNYTYCKDDDCYLDYAFEFQEEASCSLVSSNSKAAGCRSAIVHKDGCKDLADSNRYLCYYIYALGENSPTRCYYINGDYDSEIAYDCFTHFAIEQDNPSLCTAIVVLKRWDCYTDYALATGNKEGCYAIDTRAPVSRENCFEDYAYAYDDLQSCNEIDTQYEKQICYSALIFGAEELTFTECSAITIPEWKDKCFQELAVLEDEMTYCNYIEGETVKENCYSEFF